jgi:hypothetical protein
MPNRVAYVARFLPVNHMYHNLVRVFELVGRYVSAQVQSSKRLGG